MMVISSTTRTETVRVTLDVKLPGRVTELHPMGKFGMFVHDSFLPLLNVTPSINNVVFFRLPGECYSVP